MTSLRSAFARLDVRLRLAVRLFRHDIAERTRDPFRGLYISEAEIDELLTSDGTSDAVDQLLAAPVAEITPRFGRLAALFSLSPFEQEVLLVCLAPDVDARYERLYGYLQDDVTRRRPTIGLILTLLGSTLSGADPEARAALSASGHLFQRGLLTVEGEDAARMPLLARPLQVAERVVEYVLGSDLLDSHVAVWAELFAPADPAECGLAPEHLAGVVRLLNATGTPPIIYLQGSVSSGKRTTARAACAAAGRPLLLVDAAGLLASEREGACTSIGAIAREAVLQDAVLGLDEFDALLNDHAVAVTQVRSSMQRVLRVHPLPVMLLGSTHWEPAIWLAGRTAVRVELPALEAGARVALWRGLPGQPLPGSELDELAARYRLTDDTSIAAVLADARGRALLRGAEYVESIDLVTAARAVASPPLEGLATRVEPRYGWDDIVLPTDAHAQLRELCARLKHRRTVLETWGYGHKHARRAGLTALFAGQPGTGKTMAAEIVAGELGLDLYRIDLSAVVSKYVGETEKNLERIFRAADQGDGVLLFDEADAIFGKRSEVRDAQDRYANVEVAYLLQRLEAYQGLVVLTSNLRANIDEAFIRRLDFVLEFPIPEEVERLAIWQRALPAQAPRAHDVDLAFLARKFRLAGGHIRNIALTAAFLAAGDSQTIRMAHLVRATRREHQKLGKLVGEADFEQYYALLKEGAT